MGRNNTYTAEAKRDRNQHGATKPIHIEFPLVGGFDDDPWSAGVAH
jgi:hypothetical protein